MYKEASKLGIKLDTPKGLLFPHQLWLIGMPDLVTSIKTAYAELYKDGHDELSFLLNSYEFNEINQLKFNILKDVFLTRTRLQNEKLEQNKKKNEIKKIIEDLTKKQNDLTKLGDQEFKKLLEI